MRFRIRCPFVTVALVALLAVAPAVTPVAAAPQPAGGKCALAADSGTAPPPAGGLFEPVAPLPVSFAVGLVRLASDRFAVTDRHLDQVVLLDARGDSTGVLAYPAYEPSALAWDGRMLVAADGENGRIYFLDPRRDECVRTIESPLAGVTGVAADAEGRLWIAARGQEVLQLIDPHDGTTLREIPAPTPRVSALAWDPDGYLWAADSSRDAVFLVDVASGYTIFGLDAPGPVCNGLWRDGPWLYATDYQTDTLYRARVDDLHGRTLRDDSRRGRVTLWCDVQNLGPGTITGGTVALALPADGDNQELDDATWTGGAVVKTDQWGQKVALYDLGTLGPGEKRSFRLRATGTFHRVSTKIYPHRVGKLSDIPRDIREQYLADADKYRIHDPFIQQTVREVAGDATNPYVVARKLYEFLIGRINYQMVGGWDIAPTVIRRGTGSCSEYTFAYVALCRAAGIPARYVGSLVLRGEDASVDTAFHRWAEIYLPGVGWIPVDVNAGDDPLQADRCFSFGGIANRFLITTRGGGDSTLLGWDYDLRVRYRTRGKANVRTEQFAEWDVAP